MPGMPFPIATNLISLHPFNVWANVPFSKWASWVLLKTCWMMKKETLEGEKSWFLSSWTWNLLGTTETYVENYSAHDKCYGRTEGIIPTVKVWVEQRELRVSYKHLRPTRTERAGEDRGLTVHLVPNRNLMETFQARMLMIFHYIIWADYFLLWIWHNLESLGKRGPQLKGCLNQTGHNCERLSWVRIDVGGLRPLWVVPSLTVGPAHYTKTCLA